MYLKSDLSLNSSDSDTDSNTVASDNIPHELSLPYVESGTQVVDTSTHANAVTGRYKDLLLKSHFQPIYSLAHKRAVGYEALLRANNRQFKPISPLDVFKTARFEWETILLDRLSRNIHVRNFANLADDNCWLFLNTDPLVTMKGCQYGPYFKELLQAYNIPPHRTVVEILEGSISDESMLLDTANFYKELGCLIAIDDFGAGHSNFDRIWRLEPEIVKLDRSIIVQAAETHKIRRVLPNLINLIHESGSLSLIEGVETQSQALIAMDSGIDFIQGYYFGKPQATLTENQSSIKTLMADLDDKLRHISRDETHNYRKILDTQIQLLKKTAKLMEQEMTVTRASLLLLQQEQVKRCYLLNHEGKQVGPTLTSPQFTRPQDPRMKPLQEAEDASWDKRSYFQQAIKNFFKVQISKPYLSVADANLCITLSISFYVHDEIKVLCCDLDWDDLQKN